MGAVGGSGTNPVPSDSSPLAVFSLSAQFSSPSLPSVPYSSSLGRIIDFIPTEGWGGGGGRGLETGEGEIEKKTCQHVFAHC